MNTKKRSTAERIQALKDEGFSESEILKILSVDDVSQAEEPKEYNRQVDETIKGGVVYYILSIVSVVIGLTILMAAPDAKTAFYWFMPYVALVIVVSYAISIPFVIKKAKFFWKKNSPSNK